MSYTALCAAVCLAVFALATAAAAGAIRLCSTGVRRMAASLPPSRRAAALFAAIISPWTVGVAASLGVALPAFLIFEPRWSGESVGLQLPLLAAGGLLWVAWSLIRLCHLQWRTAQAERDWRQRSTAEAGVHQLADGGPLLGTVGLVRPRIYVSCELVRGLTREEFAATLAHEAGHIAAADNLKRLLMNALPASSWCGALRHEWLRACEVAADEAAVTAGAGAADLASALVKAGRMRLHPGVTAAALASHLVPPGSESQVAERVRHLTDLMSGRPAPVPSRRSWWWCSLAAAAVYAAYFFPLMHAAHEALERLVR